jgi:hypothetical protein
MGYIITRMILNEYYIECLIIQCSLSEIQNNSVFTYQDRSKMNKLLQAYDSLMMSFGASAVRFLEDFHLNLNMLQLYV